MRALGSRQARIAVGVGTGAIAALAALTAPARAGSAQAHVIQPLTVHTILSGAAHGWTGPDDLTSVGTDLYVSFQNGVPSTGGTTGTPTQSTIVKLGLNGTVEASWQLTGKCDGLTADPEHERVVATVNEDGNSSLYTVPTAGTGAATHYTYDANPLPHGGGTDSITVYRGSIYVIASAPSAAGGPALYQVALHGGVAHLAAAPFYDSSLATVANAGTGNPAVNLALTDPDSSTVVPRQSPRFAGDFMLDAQGDQQAVFASRLGTDSQQLRVLNLSQSVDDTAFATSADGALVATDSSANSVVLITGRFTPGAAYTSVTPGNANTPPVPTPANYLGVIDLDTGTVKPVDTTGTPLATHALIYLATGGG